MTNHACIAIGINRYQFLQPLNYGQTDAQGLQEFLVEQANLPSENCLLLTDTSLPIHHQSTYPNRENIWHWLAASRQNSHNHRDNTLERNWRWFFFSGYGVCWQEVDYLMPIDGNPKDIPGTGIAVRSLFQALKDKSDDHLLVFLDINRSPGLQAGSPAGAQTVDLAHELGIPLVLSAQLDQFSHEAVALGNGLFTAALLEALRYHQTDITLRSLDEYLRDRLPELSKHHWRPIQIPLTIIPAPELRQQLILPTAVKQPTQPAVASHLRSGTSQNIKETDTTDSSNGANRAGTKISASALGLQPITSLVPAPVTAREQRALTPLEMLPTPEPDPESEYYTTQKRSWQSWPLIAGGVILIVLLLLAVVTIRNRQGAITQQAIETKEEKETEKETEKVLPSTPMPPASTPQTEENSIAVALKPDQSRWQTNQSSLDQARRLIQPNQASLFSQAIAQARQIRPGEPLYEQAQQDITRWSQVILDLGEGRAQQGNFVGAIAAAKLIPGDNPSIYAKAQQAIKQWQVLAQQQQQNQRIIQTAKQQLRRHQASSYNRAISTLQKVPSSQPGYAEAQKLIAQWSRQIYLIANSRAWQGNFGQAIQTAALVPPGTPEYTTAQQAIARWRVGKR